MSLDSLLKLPQRIGTYVGPEGMDIDWMTGNELSEAIPPAYTEWVGRQLIQHIATEAA